MVLLTVSFIAQAQAEVELYQYYPNCDYPILEEAQASGRIRLGAGDSLEHSVEKARLMVIEQLLNEAREKGADGVILIDKEIELSDGVKHSRINRNQVSFTAQLVNNCFSDAPLSDRPTPFDEKGLKRQSLKSQTLSFSDVQYRLVIDAGVKRQTPKLSSHSINFSEGAYGLPLDSTEQQAVDRFGTPTARFHLNEQLTLLAYGRDMWLTFEQGKLVDISNENSWLSNELLSMQAFDDRFAAQSWQVLEGITHNMPIDDLPADFIAKGNSPVHLAQSNGNQVLSLHGEALRMVHEEKPEYTLAYYHLAKQGYSPRPLAIAINPIIADRLNQFLTNQEREGLQVNALQKYAIGQIWVDKHTQLLVMDNHYVLEIKNGMLNKVHLLESAFDKARLQTAQYWQLGALRQGQGLEQIEAHLGDDVFAFGDTLEVSKEHYLQELFFIESSDGLVLNTAEIAIY